VIIKTKVIDRERQLGRKLKTKVFNNYYRIGTIKDNKQYNRPVHRLVASLFIDNENNCKCVNHKDGVKTNNSISNLEWCTHSENMHHAVKNGLFIVKSGRGNHLSKPVKQIKDGVVIAVYGSQREAGKVLGISSGNISGACKGKIKKLAGFNWEYEN